MHKNKLILMIGLPLSGKSTWAKKQGHPIVNPDSIRLALHGQRFLSEAEAMVWTIAMYMVKALFLAGHDTVIVDATHTTPKRRDFWKSPEYPSWELGYVYNNTAKDVCIARANAVGDTEIIPIIEDMAEKMDLTGCPDFTCSA